MGESIVVKHASYLRDWFDSCHMSIRMKHPALALALTLIPSHMVERALDDYGFGH